MRRGSSGEKWIYRHLYTESNPFNGWRIDVRTRGRRVYGFTADLEHGGSEQSLRAAIEMRDRWVEEIEAESTLSGVEAGATEGNEEWQRLSDKPKPRPISQMMRWRRKPNEDQLYPRAD